ncbi:MAG TPA: SRPBCC family protein [Xanthobacteraceae bacterium]|nr:SRPBCC family protein [Xanthobacteraceae bacterium]
MEFDNSFDVPLSPAQAWAVLMDIRRIAPCMPGAALTEVIDAQNFRGKIAVRLGPVALAFAGRVQFEDVDETNHSARVKAQGSDDKGRGSANATATFRIEPADIGSRVFIHTDLMLSGAVAQYGRGVGMIQATASQIIGQFASNLRVQLERQPGPATPDVPSPPIVPERTPAPPRSAPMPASARPSPPELPPLPAAKPISGLTLLARVIWQQVRALFSGRKD